jgi:signal transduction histidine kinase
MLNDAIDGKFSETIYDETKLSSVEMRFKCYLSQSVLSLKNLKAEKDKIKSLIADISHQTKIPVANILLYSQLLFEHELPNECKMCADALVVQADKLNFLISSLIKTSRLESCIITVIPKEHTISELLFVVRMQIEHKAKDKGICIYFPQTDSTAFFDLRWTEEAVFNILDNAVKYSPSNSEIYISVKKYEIFYRIDIADHGMGISEEE